MESADHGSVFFAIKNNTCFAFDDAEEVAVILFQEPSANCDANGRGSFDSVDIYRNGNGKLTHCFYSVIAFCIFAHARLYLCQQV